MNLKIHLLFLKKLMQGINIINTKLHLLNIKKIIKRKNSKKKVLLLFMNQKNHLLFMNKLIQVNYFLIFKQLKQILKELKN